MNSSVKYYVAQIFLTMFLIVLGIQCVFLLITGNSNIQLSLIVLIYFLIILVVEQFISRKPLPEEIRQELMSKKPYYILQLVNMYFSRLISAVATVILIYSIFVQEK